MTISIPQLRADVARAICCPKGCFWKNEEPCSAKADEEKASAAIAAVLGAVAEETEKRAADYTKDDMGSFAARVVLHVLAHDFKEQASTLAGAGAGKGEGRG
jgi:hypothetical protein